MGRFTQSLARRFKGSSRPESPVQAASPAPPPATATLEPSAESPAPGSFAPEISAPNLQGRLWNQAYDGVKADEPKIAEAYERLLPELQNDANSALASNEHAERGRQMEQLVEIGLQRTEKAAALTEKAGDGLQTLMTVKSLVSSAIQAAPAAAVAWVGVCFALEVLSNSFTEASTNRTGLAYVVSRMDWYWNLVDLLLDSGAKTELAGLRGRLEVHIIRLYQQLLLYQMRSVCLFHQNQGVVFLKNSIKLDDWKGQLDGIKAAEAALLEDSKQYNSQRVHKQLQDLAHIAEGQRDKLELMTSAIQDQTSRQEQMYQDEKDSQCLHALCETDPRLDKARIQDNKGGLLRDSYAWVLKNPEFDAWQTNPHHGLLWIRGDPGKGKTMLLCGILDELEKDSTSQKAYFFCQETNRNLNNATAVLRGLIFSLVCQQPNLISHVRKEYDPVGQKLFEGSNVWEAMSKILTAILSDASLNSTFLVVDALDECGEGRAKLLKLIVALSVSPRIKWVVSSRNWVDIQEQLNIADQKVTLHLELNEKSISAAVKAYIRDKVGELARLKEYDPETRATVEQTFVDKADNTFLWVALVFQELAAPDVQSWEVPDILQALPSGLYPLYQRMMDHIEQSRHKKLCRDILAAVSVVYRPISVQELPSLVDSLTRFAKNPLALEKLISCCDSFLTLQGSVISFVHQSAKDFLLSEETIDQILPSGIQHQHRAIFSSSVKALSETLRRDIYRLEKPGAYISDTSPPSPDPLAPVRYSCAYWVDHLQDADITADLTQQHLRDDGTVHDFLRRKYLYWLEAACFSRDISGAILALQKVETQLTKITSSKQLSALIRDALRFVHWCRSGIESTPLQLYASALLFSPRRSLVRNLFESDAFMLIQSLSSQIPADWDSCAQTLEGHHHVVQSVAFAPDGRLASASDDRRIKVWDLATSACISTLEGHHEAVLSVAFALDGLLASASEDSTIKVWDPATGACTVTLEGHNSSVSSVAFAPDGRLASASYDKTVKIWDLVTGACTVTLEGHTDRVNSVAFASDGRLASASSDHTVKIWALVTGACTVTLEGHDDDVNAVAFAPDGRLASASDDETVKIWDLATSDCTATLDGHRDWVQSVSFSSDGRLASTSDDRTIKVWDLATSVCVITLEGLMDDATSVAFAPDGRRLVSASHNDTIKVWDPIAGTSVATFDGHSHQVSSLAFSLDRRWLASGSHDKTVKVWDPITCTSVATFEGHRGLVCSVAFSTDGRRLASASDDDTVKVWDFATSVCVATLEGHQESVWSVAFAPDGRRLASASYDKVVKVWDPAVGVCVQTYHVEELVRTLAFSSTTMFELAFNDHTLTLEPWATDHELQQVSHAPQSSHTLSVSSDEAWIRKDGEEVLWLPPEYRPYVVAVAGPLLAVGCNSGRVMFYTSI